MSEATLIFQHMRGGCATVGNTVHALFRVNGRRPASTEQNKPLGSVAASSAADVARVSSRSQDAS